MYKWTTILSFLFPLPSEMLSASKQHAKDLKERPAVMEMTVDGYSLGSFLDGGTSQARSGFQDVQYLFPAHKYTLVLQPVCRDSVTPSGHFGWGFLLIRDTVCIWMGTWQRESSPSLIIIYCTAQIVPASISNFQMSLKGSQIANYFMHH